MIQKEDKWVTSFSDEEAEIMFAFVQSSAYKVLISKINAERENIFNGLAVAEHMPRVHQLQGRVQALNYLQNIQTIVATHHANKIKIKQAKQAEENARQQRRDALRNA